MRAVRVVAELPERSHRVLRQLVRRHVASAAGTTEHVVRAHGSLASYSRELALNASRSVAFQHAAEAQVFAAHDGSPHRRVSHDALRHAARRGWSADELARRLGGRTCDTRGLRLGQLAARRTFNESWWTFKSRNLHRDALFFLLDLTLNVGFEMDSFTWLGVPLEQVHVCVPAAYQQRAWLQAESGLRHQLT